MNRNTAILTAFLVFAIAVAGCTAPGGGNNTDQEDGQGEVTVTKSDGLTIRFSSVDTEYYEGEGKAVFTADVQNTGEAQATQISHTLIGASWAAGLSPSGAASSLIGVEVADNKAGGKSVFEIQAPESGDLDVGLGPGQSDPATITLKTTYNYKSTTRSSITLLAQQKYRERSQSRTRMRNNVAGAPVHVKFTGLTPAPDRDTGPYIDIQMQNVGNGRLQDERVDGLSVRTPDGTDICSWGGGDARIRASRTLSCDLASLDLAEGVDEQSFTLIAEANYTYIEEHPTTITVIGQ